MKLTHLFPLFLILTMGSGCASLGNGEHDLPVTSSSTTQLAHEAMMEMMTARAIPADTRIVFKHGDTFKTGDVEFAFKLYSQDGLPLGERELKTVHERRLHLLLVRDDLTEYQHLHPLQEADGFWTIKTPIPTQGTYQLYVDIAPYRETPTVLRVPIIVGGKTLRPIPPQASAHHSVEVNGYKAVLSANGPFRAGEMTDWTFSLMKEGKPVENIEPYLGAYGHVVNIKHDDPNGFFHAHPVRSTQPSSGHIVFVGLFPTKGFYTLFAQFSINNSVETFPITVHVTEEYDAGSRKDGMGHSEMEM